MTTPNKYKINIFDVLSKISKKNNDFYKDFSLEQQKGFHPLIIMRWLSGIKSERQIVFLNELVNPYVFSLNKHKQLLVDLMCVCTSGKSTKYLWLKKTNKTKGNLQKTTEIIKTYFKYNTKHAVDVIPLLSDEDILLYAEQLGTQPDDLKLIKKELKSRI